MRVKRAFLFGYALLLALASTVAAFANDTPKPKAQVVAERLASNYAAEVRDESWAQPEEALLQGIIGARSASVQASVHAIGCRTSICRIDLSGPGRDAEAVREELLKTKPRAEIFFYPGPPEAVIFVVREGFVLERDP